MKIERGRWARLVESLAGFDGFAERLAVGSSVACVGRDAGGLAVAIAASFPHARVYGFDPCPEAVSASRRTAEAVEVGRRTVLDVATATSYDGLYDVICLVEGPMAPDERIEAARHAWRRVSPGGAVLVVEPSTATVDAHRWTEQ